MDKYFIHKARLPILITGAYRLFNNAHKGLPLAVPVPQQIELIVG